MVGNYKLPTYLTTWELFVMAMRDRTVPDAPLMGAVSSGREEAGPPQRGGARCDSLAAFFCEGCIDRASIKPPGEFKFWGATTT